MLKRSLFKSFSILFFSVFFQNLAFSCICDTNVPFCNHVTVDNQIILVEVLQNPVNTYDMEVKVIESLHTPFLDDTIIVAGQNGWNCNEQLGQFSINDTLVLALGSIPTSTGSWNLLYCGYHYLRYGSGMVTGKISYSVSQMPYSQFKQDIPTCINGTLSTEKLNNELELNLFPNPTSNGLSVESNQAIIGYEVFNSMGQRLSIEKFEVEHPSIQINTNLFKDGVHWLMLRTSKGIITRKFLKVSRD